MFVKLSIRKELKTHGKSFLSCVRKYEPDIYVNSYNGNIEPREVLA